MYRTNDLLLKYVLPLALTVAVGLGLLGIHVPWYVFLLVLPALSVLALMLYGRWAFAQENLRLAAAGARRESLATDGAITALAQLRDQRHPTWWTLTLWIRGELSADEARAVRVHLEEAHCAPCQARRRGLELVRDRMVRFLEPLVLPNPKVARASTAQAVNVAAMSADQALEVDCLEAESQLVLEVRTREARLNHQVLGYALCASDGNELLTGYLVLRPDVNDWFAAGVRFDIRELHDRFRDRGIEVLLCPVDAGLLTDEERQALLASVERSRDNSADRAAWEACAKGRLGKGEPSAEQERQLAQAILARLEAK